MYPPNSRWISAVNILNINALYKFEGYVVEQVSCQEIGAQIKLRFDERCGPRCPNCKSRLPKHRCSAGSAMDLPIADGLVVMITFPVVQGLCRECRHFVTTRPREVHQTKGATWRFMRRISAWTIHAPATAVAEMFEISDATVRRYDQAVLKEDLPAPNLDGLRVLLIDEKAVRKGHNYVTFVLNGDTGELLHMAEGKKKESLRSFFEKLTDEQKASIEAVGIDRAGSYQTVVQEEIPNAAIVYDHFHLRLNLNEAVDEVRRQEWGKAKKKDKSFIKGSRYILLANEENLDDKGASKLAAIKEANENISTAYYLKEQFREIHTYRYSAWAMKSLTQWCDLAAESGLAAFEGLSKSFRKQAEQIISYCKHRVTSGTIEGFNNLVSRLVHRACGITNFDYAWLKFRQLSIKHI